MVGFFVYDLSFLVLFCAFVAWFLYSRKKGLQREGIMFLYKTKFGMTFIDHVGTKYKKVLHALKYPIILVGYGLMGMIIYMLGLVVYTYIALPEIVDVVKAPPVMPLIPYFPQIFGVESFFPPFYFIYFLIAIIIVAFSHEFAHGIYMRLYKIKIKSTGIAFLGPILGAFVEQDDKDMQSKPATQQMTVLGAGVFANLILALIFFLLMVGFFSVSFAPAGYVFSSYAVSEIPIGSISGFGERLENTEIILNTQLKKVNLTQIEVGERSYFMVSELVPQVSNLSDKYAYVFDDAPAINVRLQGIVREIDGVKITGQKSLAEYLEGKSPGDQIVIKTLVDGEEMNYELILDEHPLHKGGAYLGVGSAGPVSGGFKKVLSIFVNFKNPSTYYEPSWNGEIVNFIYNLLWWVAIINFFVALFNMLPVGILDGGRFFYLTVRGITKSEKIGKRAFKIMTWLILLLFISMILSWIWALV